ncbi:hypothetical protein CXB51_013915 [Gossypium anomalum]|uniref:RNA ligase/cyclic nucleotide phosphodiesterase family protein n=1 Tax=Gossypium anomalum TaxID=47600 RepID=A0A8J5YQQ1_9ROSI|nr:hypothetical protein CXB51_013915 [Gossypium anomalum]
MCHLAQVAILKPQTHIFSIFKSPYSISKSLQIPTNYSLTARSTSMGTPEAVVKKDVYSVWALPPEDVTARVKKLMEGLRSEFGGPQFEPHVTVVGAISLTADDALAKFRSACDGRKAYNATVDRVATGTFFYQCVFLLLHPTPEVVETSAHFNSHFGYKSSTRKLLLLNIVAFLSNRFGNLSYVYWHESGAEMVQIIEGRVTKQVKITFDCYKFLLRRKGVLRRGQRGELIDINGIKYLYLSFYYDIHCVGHFLVAYMPHLSLLYAYLTEEEKKKAQEKANMLDESISSLSFQISRLALYKTDTEDKTLKSWEKVAECNLSPN